MYIYYNLRLLNFKNKKPGPKYNLTLTIMLENTSSAGIGVMVMKLLRFIILMVRTFSSKAYTSLSKFNKKYTPLTTIKRTLSLCPKPKPLSKPKPLLQKQVYKEEIVTHETDETMAYRRNTTKTHTQPRHYRSKSLIIHERQKPNSRCQSETRNLRNRS